MSAQEPLPFVLRRAPSHAASGFQVEPCGPTAAEVLEARPGEDVDAWVLVVRVHLGPTVSRWMVSIDRLDGHWRSVVRILEDGPRWTAAQRAARSAGLSYGKARRVERLTAARPCETCGETFRPNARGEAKACRSCQRDARRGVFAGQARTRRARRQLLELLRAYERELVEREARLESYVGEFVCSRCARPQGTHELCGGTWVPGWMMLQERPALVLAALWGRA